MGPWCTCLRMLGLVIHPSLSIDWQLKLQMKAKDQRRKGRRRRNTVFEDDLTPLRKEIEASECLKDEEWMDMLLWLKDHGEAFPLLSFLVRVVFSNQAASSKSERVLSAAGSLISQGRIRLNQEKVEDILNIKLNLALFREHGK